MTWSPVPSAEVGGKERLLGQSPNQVKPRFISRLFDWYLVTLSSMRPC